MKKFFTYLRTLPEDTRRTILYVSMGMCGLIILGLWSIDLTLSPRGNFWSGWDFGLELPEPPETAREVAREKTFHTASPAFAISEEITAQVGDE